MLEASELRPIAGLVPYARNSRTHSEEQIAQLVESMREWGFTMPVLVDEAGGIIAGHGRVMAATRIGLMEVPVLVARGWSDAKKRAYVIADNKLALNAGWDEEILAAEMAELQAMGFNLELTGFSNEELLDMLNEEHKEGKTDDDAVPEQPKVPVSRLGDVWVCGPHRVMCGDSTKPANMATLMAGVQADLLLTDPPYNVAYEGKTADALKIDNDSMGDTAFRAFLVALLGTAMGVLKPGGVFYVWHADSEGHNFRGACHDVGLKIRQCLIWLKNTMVMGRQDYHWKHEPCLYGWKDGAAHYWGSDRKQVTVLEFDKPSRNGEHPTMKPVALFEYQLLNNTRPGEVVLDVCGGSGTTLIAAEKNGRLARLMELGPNYADVIVTRWQEHAGLEATLESTGEYWPEVRVRRAAEDAAAAEARAAEVPPVETGAPA